MEGFDAKSHLIIKAKQRISEIDGWLGKKDKENLTYPDLKKWALFEIELSNLIDEAAAHRKSAEKSLAKQGEQALEALADDIINSSKDIKGIKVIAAILPGKDISFLRKLADAAAAKAPASAILLASDLEGKANLVLLIGKDLVKKGLNAKELISPIAACVGGSGGGRPDMAQAGGKDITKIKEAVNLIYDLIGEKKR